MVYTTATTVQEHTEHLAGTFKFSQSKMVQKYVWLAYIKVENPTVLDRTSVFDIFGRIAPPRRAKYS